MIVFYHEPCQRERSGIIASMYASIVGMTNSSDPALLP
jgi:hypothetical protein